MANVLLVAHQYPPHIGGLENVVAQQARSLVAAGHRVVVVTSRTDRSAPSHALEAGVEVIRIASLDLLERRFGIPFPLPSLRLWWVLWRETARADLVHLHDVFYVTSWVGFLASRSRRRPVVLTQHVALVAHPSRLVMAVQRAIYATIGRRIFGSARAIVAYNTIVAEFLRRQGVPADRIRLMPNGIDTTWFQPATVEVRTRIRSHHGLPAHRPIVLFVGRLVDKKGFQVLLEARDPAFELVFVGPGTVPRPGRVQGVHWLGPRDAADIRDLMQASDVFAFPAVGEVCTLVMQEAMACGLPVVTTDDPAYRGTPLEDAARYCARDPATLRSTILELLGDAETRSRLAVRGRQVAVAEFEWNANVGRLLDVYFDILQRTSPGP